MDGQHKKKKWADGSQSGWIELLSNKTGEGRCAQRAAAIYVIPGGKYLCLRSLFLTSACRRFPVRRCRSRAARKTRLHSRRERCRTCPGNLWRHQHNVENHKQKQEQQWPTVTTASATAVRALLLEGRYHCQAIALTTTGANGSLPSSNGRCLYTAVMVWCLFLA